MKIGISNDHHGVELKNKIIKSIHERGIECINFGTNDNESVDYVARRFLAHGQKFVYAKRSEQTLHTYSTWCQPINVCFLEALILSLTLTNKPEPLFTELMMIYRCIFGALSYQHQSSSWSLKFHWLRALRGCSGRKVGRVWAIWTVRLPV